MISQLEKSLSQEMDECLDRMTRGRVAVVGDFCLDAYWHLQDRHELSLETGLPVRHVLSQRYAPGGAGNVAMNLVALGVAQVSAIGVVGRDPFGDVLYQLLQKEGINVDGMIRDQHDWQTCVYAKPYLGKQEQNRFDFGGFNEVQNATVDRLIAALQSAAKSHDAIIINQQIPQGIYSPQLIHAINRIIQEHPQLIVMVDSRDHATDFAHACLKMNVHEAARFLHDAADGAHVGIAKAREFANRYFQRTGKPVFLTRGERGLLVADGRGIHEIPAVQVSPPIDSVGAGDTAIAVIAAVLAVRKSSDAAVLAGTLANIAASVVLKKINTTGTAMPQEIRRAGADPDYIYHPELATDARAAVYWPDTQIEIIHKPADGLAIRHAIFDHDGTLSTLREGWEKIMEPMMIQAILGKQYKNADMALLEQVTLAARDFIDRTTGIQTLGQMTGLVNLVRQFGCVPESEILDEHGYKAIYNKELLEMVHRRVRKLERGELEPADFQLKNAHELLRRLHRAGVTLYLASGTDVQDVIVEARAMGYADLFGDRIFGAVGDVNVEAKKMVLERIMREHELCGLQLVTFGDGPVEIRETHKRSGVAVGVTSDEVRRFGHNPAKRKRLIQAGADILIPDFSQLDSLLSLLKIV